MRIAADDRVIVHAGAHLKAEHAACIPTHAKAFGIAIAVIGHCPGGGVDHGPLGAPEVDPDGAAAIVQIVAVHTVTTVDLRPGEGPRLQGHVERVVVIGAVEPQTIASERVLHVLNGCGAIGALVDAQAVGRSVQGGHDPGIQIVMEQIGIALPRGHRAKINGVVARPGLDTVPAAHVVAGIQEIIAGTAVELVVAIPAIQQIITVTAVQRVVATVPNQQRRGRRFSTTVMGQHVVVIAPNMFLLQGNTVLFDQHPVICHRCGGGGRSVQIPRGRTDHRAVRVGDCHPGQAEPRDLRQIGQACRCSIKADRLLGGAEQRGKVPGGERSGQLQNMLIDGQGNRGGRNRKVEPLAPLVAERNAGQRQIIQKIVQLGLLGRGQALQPRQQIKGLSGIRQGLQGLGQAAGDRQRLLTAGQGVSRGGHRKGHQLCRGLARLPRATQDDRIERSGCNAAVNRVDQFLQRANRRQATARKNQIIRPTRHGRCQFDQARRQLRNGKRRKVRHLLQGCFIIQRQVFDGVCAISPRLQRRNK
ncbi:hypothetical protein TRM7615_05054 [Falsiruegeria mediterranea M17]|uniref:Uncharacterized protein n=1 Tax=Falsiruegeria mediterranea M17 TaxID=1200281 RepID=A0A2R8CGG0_9RHOB|nr:hypothetical protein TRM7615_05054 [Falsiruegeria mediterranea M17]